MLIGIMGKIDSGRLLVTKIISEEDRYDIIHIDDIYWDLLKKEEIKKEIDKRFESQVGIDYHVMLYTDEGKRKEYNSLIWQYLEKEIDKRIKEAIKPVIIEWDKLPFTKYYDECDIKILVDFDRNIRIDVGKAFGNQTKINYPKDYINYLFYCGSVDCYIDYKIGDMDYVVDDNYILAGTNKIDNSKVKSLGKRLILNDKDK